MAQAKNAVEDQAHESDSELARCLSEAATLIAEQQPITAAAVMSILGRGTTTHWSPRKRTRALIRLSRDFLARGQLGRVRGALLAGVVDLGREFLPAFERSGVLLTNQSSVARFGQFLARLEDELDSSSECEWALLRDRIHTYRAYNRLALEISRRRRDALRPLSTDPRHIIKKVFALAQLAFMRQYFRTALPPELEDRISRFGTAERVAGVASCVVALANERRPLDSWDLGAPMVDDLCDEALWNLMDYGRAVVTGLEIGKQVSLFGYCLETSKAAPHFYYVRPPYAEFEYYQLLGYVRAELGSDLLNISKQDNVPEVSLMSLAEMFLQNQGDRTCQLMDEGTPYRRIRLAFPIVPELVSLVTSVGVYDDVAERERLAQEFMFPLRLASDGPILLTATLTLEEFMRIWRLMRFLALVDVAAVRPYHETDHVVFFNSTVRVSKEQELVDLISSMGFDAAKVSEFLDLVSARVDGPGYYDMQYRPFLRIASVELPAKKYRSPAEIIHVSAVVATSNVLRNVQVTNRLRLRQMSGVFVAVVADMLRERFADVVTNRRVEAATGKTDIDVVVLEGETLYLFECKHSVFPVEPHEMRDAWEDIEHGVTQLRRALDALSDPQRRRDYLAGWFPGRKQVRNPALRISRCILCSHRVFSGMEYDGIPIRDYASFAKLTGGGVISVTTSEEGPEAVSQRFQLTSESGFSAADLDDYLSAESKYFKIFWPFMRPVSSITVAGGLKIARETYVFAHEIDRWAENLETIGGRRLTDERVRLKLPASFDDILAQLSSHEKTDREDV